MAKVACRQNMCKVNGLLGKKEDEEEEERKKIQTKRKAFLQLCGKSQKSEQKERKAFPQLYGKANIRNYVEKPTNWKELENTFDF